MIQFDYEYNDNGVYPEDTVKITPHEMDSDETDELIDAIKRSHLVTHKELENGKT